MHNARKRLLAGPYLVWIIGFTVLPILMILYYLGKYCCNCRPGTYKSTPAFLEAWYLMYGCLSPALLPACHDIKQSSYQASELCGIYLRPANVDELHAAYFSMADVTFQ